MTEKKARNRDILRDYKEGKSHGELAEKYNLTKQRIGTILNSFEKYSRIRRNYTVSKQAHQQRQEASKLGGRPVEL